MRTDHKDRDWHIHPNGKKTFAILLNGPTCWTLGNPSTPSKRSDLFTVPRAACLTFAVVEENVLTGLLSS